MIAIEFEIIECYDGEAPEPFGYQAFPADRIPRLLDVVMLKWLDGSDAYQVRVIGINGSTMHVEAVKPSVTLPATA